MWRVPGGVQLLLSCLGARGPGQPHPTVCPALRSLRKQLDLPARRCPAGRSPAPLPTPHPRARLGRPNIVRPRSPPLGSQLPHRDLLEGTAPPLSPGLGVPGTGSLPAAPPSTLCGHGPHRLSALLEPQVPPPNRAWPCGEMTTALAQSPEEHLTPQRAAHVY